MSYRIGTFGYFFDAARGYPHLTASGFDYAKCQSFLVYLFVVFATYSLAGCHTANLFASIGPYRPSRPEESCFVVPDEVGVINRPLN
jgi:hypothetical protein